MIKIYEKNNPLNLKEIFKYIKQGEDILIRTYQYDDEFDYIIERIIEKILALYRLEIIKNSLIFCIRELTGNSRKAIVKRIFFTEKSLNIFDEKDYEKGMNIFHKYVYNEIDLYNDKMKDFGYFISFHIIHNENNITIKVESNTELTSQENKRIQNKLSKVKSLTDLGSHLDSIIDSTEGAGLGLIMISMMLEKEGIDSKSFSIYSENDKTISKITVSKNEIKETTFSIIAKSLINEIKTLPQFPDNIKKILNMMNNEKSSLSDIANIILRDISLAADLLKLANSAFFMLPKKVKSIEEALKIVGFKGLKNLIYSYGTIKTLTEKYGKFGKLEEIWTHSNIVSFYSYELAKIRKLKDIAEDAAIAGLLHDLGKIIIMTIQPDTIQKIKKILIAKNNIHTPMVEELILGINHAKLGSMMAEHWNFPDNLIKAIEYHHSPGFAIDDLIPIVNCVYFANALTEIEKNTITTRNIIREVLEFFDIYTQDDFKEIHQSLKIKLDTRLSEIKNNDEK